MKIENSDGLYVESKLVQRVARETPKNELFVFPFIAVFTSV